MNETSDETRLRALYAAFNARDIEAALAGLHPDVDWANGLSGGSEIGREAVRAYWTRQWQTIDPRVEPVAIVRLAADALAVDVHQVVRDRAGALLSDRQVRHVYVVVDGLVRRMRIVEASSSV